ncbi:DUF1465 family protein [Aurantiacibacter aquimixticola]|uniref:DUF1465 family protein n=1 Tax=Aurantiacibacter aquimixticola TaxID=1958945 RepID=A0A419RTQ6_9SPHN|nr:DUF1465 family protein [Aurantiacibacter aquimixticola]RJY09171.1 DUF1465 family protein [Aurantiacibacter aquimixticola]
MTIPSALTPAIVDVLYEEALCLVEEARCVFDEAPTVDATALRSALSREALRTTTQLMHAMAWLLNHRAFFAGDMSALQLRRHGRLPPTQHGGQAKDAALLDARVRAVSENASALHERIARLDEAWQAELPGEPAAVHRLHEKLGRAFG